MTKGIEGGPHSCGVQGCPRPVVAKGLCTHHYKRQRDGKPLVDDGPRVGEKSGYGLYGILARDEHAVLCHECGQRFASVASHLNSAHGLTAREYKRRHGLPAGTPLVSLAQSRAQSEAAKARVGGAGWQRLEAARDPIAASHSRTDEAFTRRGPDKQAAAETARDNGAAYRGKPHPCPVCGTVIPATRVTCSPTCRSRWLGILSRREAAARRRRLTPAETEELLAASLTDPGPVIRRLQAAGIYSADLARVLRISPATFSRRWPLNPDQLTERLTRPLPAGTNLKARRGRQPRPLVDAHPDLAAQWHPTLNALPVDQVTTRTPGRHWWTCPSCGEARQATITSRIIYPTRVCRACNPAVVTKPLAVHRPDLAVQWHPTLNSLRLDQVGTGTKRSVWWLCPDCDQPWQAPVVQRVRHGRSCPRCRTVAGTPAAQQPSPDLTPDQVAYLGDWKPVDQWTRRALELRAQGVTLAAMARHHHVGVPTISRRMARHVPDQPTPNQRPTAPKPAPKPLTPQPLTITHPDIAADWHPTLNTVTADQVTARTPGRHWWACRHCGQPRQAQIATRLKAPDKPCPACKPRPPKPITKPLTAYRPDLAAQWHPTLNASAPDQVGVGSQSRVWWLCPDCGHAWQTSVAQRVNKHSGCPQCAIATRVRTTKARARTTRPNADLTAEQIAFLGDFDDIPAWSARAWQLRDQGVTGTAMARHYGVTHATIYQRLEHHAQVDSHVARRREPSGNHSQSTQDH